MGQGACLNGAFESFDHFILVGNVVDALGTVFLHPGLHLCRKEGGREGGREGRRERKGQAVLRNCGQDLAQEEKEEKKCRASHAQHTELM